ncbi:MAG TPA: hypothetical protein VGM56_32175 [Byssovorax sp.]|jgi:hypothetical protein
MATTNKSNGKQHTKPFTRSDFETIILGVTAARDEQRARADAAEAELAATKVGVQKLAAEAARRSNEIDARIAEVEAAIDAPTIARSASIEDAPGASARPHIEDAALGLTYEPNNRCARVVDVSKLPLEAILYEAAGYNGYGDVVSNLLATSVRILRMLNSHITHEDVDEQEVEALILDITFKLRAAAELHRRIVTGLTSDLVGTLDRAGRRLVVEGVVEGEEVPRG